jgi:hypothetical protein
MPAAFATAKSAADSLSHMGTAALLFKQKQLGKTLTERFLKA